MVNRAVRSATLMRRLSRVVYSSPRQRLDGFQRSDPALLDARQRDLQRVERAGHLQTYQVAADAVGGAAAHRCGSELPGDEIVDVQGPPGHCVSGQMDALGAQIAPLVAGRLAVTGQQRALPAAGQQGRARRSAARPRGCGLGRP